jgi:hypothetical protein
VEVDRQGFLLLVAVGVAGYCLGVATMVVVVMVVGWSGRRTLGRASSAGRTDRQGRERRRRE